VQQHVHAADAQHRIVEIEAVKHPMMKVLVQARVAQHFGMALAQVLTCGNEKAGSSTRRVADDVPRRRRSKLDHQPDDVPRRAELSVLPGGGDLAEHVFIEITLGIAILHRHLIDQVHDLCEQRGHRNCEPRILHVVGIRRVIAAERTKERKNVLAHHRVHLGRREVLESRPSQILIGTTSCVLTAREGVPFNGFLQPRRLVLFEGL